MAQAAAPVFDERARFIAEQACSSLGIEVDAFEEVAQDPATLELVASFLNGNGPQSLLVHFVPVAKEEAPAAPEESPPEEAAPDVAPEPSTSHVEAPAAENGHHETKEEGEAPAAAVSFFASLLQEGLLFLCCM